MATPQLSPGVISREVDLTVGRVDNVLDSIGAIAGPFPIGPVDQPINITTEQELIDVFGKPLDVNGQYEYWMSASAFLSYGGVLKVVRVGGNNLTNAAAGLGVVGEGGSQGGLIKNFDDYELNFSDNNFDGLEFAAKTPGTWGNGLKVAFIDYFADETLIISGVSTTNVVNVGVAITSAVSGTLPSGDPFDGALKAIVTGVTTLSATDYLIDVKITHLISNFLGIENPLNYAEKSPLFSFAGSSIGNSITISGINTTTQYSSTLDSAEDWYNNQTIELSNGTEVFWNSIAPKPGTSQFALSANAKNDELNIAIFDDFGSVTGIKGNLLEKFVGLSKATDTISSTNSPDKIWWSPYLARYSKYVYGGGTPIDFVVPTGFEFGTNTPLNVEDEAWNSPAQNKTFGAIGNQVFVFSGGQDYNNNSSLAMQVELGDIISGYQLFSNRDEIEIDYLIQGPATIGGNENLGEAQAKAQYLISIANQRKDSVVVISPPRSIFVNQTNSEVQTNDILAFFSSLSSSSYAVFDSGYKYTYDRFNNKFRYIPANADIAGLMVRTSINAYPWFSPAGQQRGVLNNAIKLAYNPTKAQRDRLYTQRINAIINQSGIGILLFGDKTALGYASAFDRINVRRLFLTIEQAIERTAQAQLFELNDEITRSNFVNIVEPYLRDIQAKRGIYDFRVICDETNNTPDIIDNNEFRADIFIKPAKAINYVTITYVATRTGISFEEVTGRV